MSALDNNPSNLNQINPSGFVFKIKRMPNVNFFLQDVVIPGIQLPATTQFNPFVNVPVPGDHLVYNTLNINFVVDEDLNNYRELYNWFVALGFPQKLNQYAAIADAPKGSGNGIYSDASLILTTNLKNPNLEVVFQDCWPTAMSELKFFTTDADVEPLTCAAQFNYTLFQISAV